MYIAMKMKWNGNGHFFTLQLRLTVTTWKLLHGKLQVFILYYLVIMRLLPHLCHHITFFLIKILHLYKHFSFSRLPCFLYVCFMYISMYVTILTISFSQIVLSCHLWICFLVLLLFSGSLLPCKLCSGLLLPWCAHYFTIIIIWLIIW